MKLRIEHNEATGWKITGKKPSCDWCKPPTWPYDPEHVNEFTGCMASREFRKAVRAAAKEAYEQMERHKEKETNE